MLTAENEIGIIPTEEEKSLIGTDAYSGRLMYWSRSSKPNFGDWIGPLIFRRRTGTIPVFCRPARASAEHPVLFTCGSILERISKANVAVVWGSGRYMWHAEMSRASKILAVRGPLTAEFIARSGQGYPSIHGDPGLCMPLFFRPETKKKYKIGFVPHITELDFWLQKELPDTIRIISPASVPEPVISEIVSCEKIVSSSLHGVIMAHAYGIPAVWLDTTSRRLPNAGLKFVDYFLSVNMNMKISDAAKVADASDLIAASREACLPTIDLERMSAKLMEVCPF